MLREAGENIFAVEIRFVSDYNENRVFYTTFLREVYAIWVNKNGVL